MPLYLDIDRLHQTAMIIAHGHIDDDEVRKMAQDLLAADIVSFAKIIDTTAAIMNETTQQIEAVVQMMRNAPGAEQRGPVACVVDPKVAMADTVVHRFAELSKGDRPIRLFTSLREARQWAEETMKDKRRSA